MSSEGLQDHWSSDIFTLKIKSEYEADFIGVKDKFDMLFI